MRNIDFSPFYRSTVGFDRLFSALENNVSSDWPPYDIDKLGENDYRISMAVAGFEPDEIDMTQHGTALIVSGQRKQAKDKVQALHQGIASRNFKQTFKLADHVKVVSAELKNGMLLVNLTREIPEELKPRKIQIGADGVGTERIASNDQQVDAGAGEQAEAA